MISQKFYKRPVVIGIAIGAIIHSTSILIRELFPIPALSPVVDTIAFNSSWVYFLSVMASLAINMNQVKQYFIYIPERVTSKTVEGQRLTLAYETVALSVLLFLLPAITYFYEQVHTYFQDQHPELHRFLDYMPFTDLVNRATTSFPFFITLFTLVSLLCVIMPHTYLSYKYAKGSAAPLHSAIVFSLLLSLGVTAVILGLVALSISPWMILILFLVGPVIFFSYVIINIVMLRYHDRFIICD